MIPEEKWIWLAGKEEILAEWAARKMDLHRLWKEYTCIAQMDGVNILAVVVYTDFSFPNICMHIAGVGKKWLTRQFLYKAFWYPFEYLKCTRVTGIVSSKNREAQVFDEHIGFIKEGLLRKAGSENEDLIIYGMLKEECRFLQRKNYGKTFTTNAATTAAAA